MRGYRFHVAASAEAKVFCFFSSEKKAFLHLRWIWRQGFRYAVAYHVVELQNAGFEFGQRARRVEAGSEAALDAFAEILVLALYLAVYTGVQVA